MMTASFLPHVRRALRMSVGSLLVAVVALTVLAPLSVAHATPHSGVAPAVVLAAAAGADDTFGDDGCPDTYEYGNSDTVTERYGHSLDLDSKYPADCARQLLPAWRWRKAATNLTSDFGVTDIMPKFVHVIAGLLMVIANFFWWVLLTVLEWGLTATIASEAHGIINEMYVTVADAVTSSGLYALLILAVVIAMVRSGLRSDSRRVVGVLLMFAVSIGALNGLATRAQGPAGRTTTPQQQCIDAGISRNVCAGESTQSFATPPKGSPGWFAWRGVQMSDAAAQELIEPFTSQSGKRISFRHGFSDGDMTGMSCARYVTVLEDLHDDRTNAGSTSGIVDLLDNREEALMTAASNLWEAGYLSYWQRAQFSARTELGRPASCHLLEAQAGIRPDEQRDIAALAWDGTPPDAAVFRVDVHDNKEASRSVMAWTACRWTNSQWTIPAAYTEGGRFTDTGACNTWWAGGGAPDGVDLYKLDDENSPELRIVEEAFLGHNNSERLFSGIFSVIVAVAYLWSFGALGVGAVFAQMGLVIMMILLPVSLLALAFPSSGGGKPRLGVRMLRMTASLFLSKALFSFALVFMFVLVGIMQSLLTNSTGATVTSTLPASELMPLAALGGKLAQDFIIALSPLMALLVLKKLTKALGIGDITTLSGALGMPAAAAMKVAGESQLAANMAGHVSEAGKSIGKWGAVGAGATAAAGIGSAWAASALGRAAWKGFGGAELAKTFKGARKAHKDSAYISLPGEGVLAGMKGVGNKVKDTLDGWDAEAVNESLPKAVGRRFKSVLSRTGSTAVGTFGTMREDAGTTVKKAHGLLSNPRTDRLRNTLRGTATVAAMTSRGTLGKVGRGLMVGDTLTDALGLMVGPGGGRTPVNVDKWSDDDAKRLSDHFDADGSEHVNPKAFHRLKKSLHNARTPGEAMHLIDGFLDRAGRSYNGNSQGIYDRKEIAQNVHAFSERFGLGLGDTDYIQEQLSRPVGNRDAHFRRVTDNLVIGASGRGVDFDPRKGEFWRGMAAETGRAELGNALPFKIMEEMKGSLLYRVLDKGLSASPEAYLDSVDAAGLLVGFADTNVTGGVVHNLGLNTAAIDTASLELDSKMAVALENTVKKRFERKQELAAFNTMVGSRAMAEVAAEVDGALNRKMSGNALGEADKLISRLGPDIERIAQDLVTADEKGRIALQTRIGDEVGTEVTGVVEQLVRTLQAQAHAEVSLAVADGEGAQAVEQLASRFIREIESVKSRFEAQLERAESLAHQKPSEAAGALRAIERELSTKLAAIDVSAQQSHINFGRKVGKFGRHQDYYENYQWRTENTKDIVSASTVIARQKIMRRFDGFVDGLYREFDTDD